MSIPPRREGARLAFQSRRRGRAGGRSDDGGEMHMDRTTRYAPLFQEAATRLTQARSVGALKRGMRTTRSLWERVDRLIARGDLAVSPSEADVLRRQARYVVETLGPRPVLNDDQIEQVIEINRQATERLSPQDRVRPAAAE